MTSWDRTSRICARCGNRYGIAVNVNLPPSLLHAELSLAQRALRDLSTQETTHIRVDAKGQLAELQTFAATFTPDTLEKLSLYTGERVLFDLYNVDAEIAVALQRASRLAIGRLPGDRSN